MLVLGILLKSCGLLVLVSGIFPKAFGSSGQHRSSCGCTVSVPVSVYAYYLWGLLSLNGCNGGSLVGGSDYIRRTLRGTHERGPLNVGTRGALGSLGKSLEGVLVYGSPLYGAPFRFP